MKLKSVQNKYSQFVKLLLYYETFASTGCIIAHDLVMLARSTVLLIVYRDGRQARNRKGQTNGQEKCETSAPIGGMEVKLPRLFRKL